MKQKIGFSNFSIKGKVISIIALIMSVLSMMMLLFPIIIEEDDSVSGLKLILNESTTNYITFLCYIQFILSVFILIYLLLKVFLSDERSFVSSAFISMGMFVVFALIYRYIGQFLKSAEGAFVFRRVGLDSLNFATILLSVQVLFLLVAFIIVVTNGYITELAANNGYDISIKIFNGKKSNANSEKDSLEILREYKALLDSGIISQEEFDRKKEQILK